MRLIRQNKTNNSVFIILKHLLKLLEIPVTNKTLKQVTSEKNYDDSIKTISDLLFEFNIKSKVYHVEYEDLLKIPCPIITHIEISSYTKYFVVVKNISAFQVKYIDQYGLECCESYTVFNNKWTGIVLVPFPTDQSGDPKYQENKKLENIERRLTISVFFGIFICTGLILYQTISNYLNYSVLWSGFLLVKLSGLILAILILKIETGQSGPFTNSICSSTDCLKVLQSTNSRIFTWLTMGDIGFIYFAGGIFILCFSVFQQELFPFLRLLVLLNYLALPITLYSVYIQAIVIKKWCLFCLSIITILWIEFLLGFSITDNQTFFLNPNVLPFSAIVYMLIILGGQQLKKIYINSIKYTSTKTYFNRLKRDSELFYAIVKSKESVSEISIKSEITLRKGPAQNTLIILLSPSCQSCVYLYNQVKDFMTHSDNNMKTVLRFIGSEERSDANQVIEWLLSLNLNGETERALYVLEIWQSMKDKHLLDLKKKSNLSNVNLNPASAEIRRTYYNWYKSLDIQGVPVMILNNKIIPKFYSFDDLKYLLIRMNKTQSKSQSKNNYIIK